MAAIEAEAEAKPAPWEVCESYNATECSAHTDRCSLCSHGSKGKQLCFDQAIAAKLPPCEWHPLGCRLPAAPRHLADALPI